MKIKVKAKVDASLCVACGTCLMACPLQAISIDKGCVAKVNPSVCVGCRKCLAICPASIIRMEEHNEKEMV